MLYLEVLLPLPIEERYIYSLDETLLESQVVEVGYRVQVSLGPKRFYTGIVTAVFSTKPNLPERSQLKPVVAILDDQALVSIDTIRQWEWMAEYYRTPLGIILRNALPQGLLPNSTTTITLNDEFEASGQLSNIEEVILRELEIAKEHQLPLLILRQRLGGEVPKALAGLISQGAVYSEEIIRSSYKPRTLSYVGLSSLYHTEEAINTAFTLLQRAKKQAEILEELLHALEQRSLSWQDRIPLQELSKGNTQRRNLIRQLIHRGILEIEERPISRLEIPATKEANTTPPHINLPNSAVTLLYAHRSESREQAILALVRQTIQNEGQVLLLSPSVHSTPSALPFLDQLRDVSGGQFFTYHPLMSEALRIETFQSLGRRKSPCLVVGNRSAVFLPLTQLRLIIVDEEHEYLYKQQFGNPHYNARDVALWLGRHFKAPVVLSSETPSAETLFNVLRQKYAILHTYAIFSEQPLERRIPIRLIDLKEAQEKRYLSFGKIITPELYNRIKATLEQGQRILLLQNRKGYAVVQCDNCGHHLKCPRCDVSMTYHNSTHRLLCHYCGLEAMKPSACPHCEAVTITRGDRQYPALRSIGYGVERIEEELTELFPDSNILRIDSDSLQTSKKVQDAHLRITSGEVDILIGTQLIKGQALWDNIGLIAVPQLQTLLGFSDFRTEERAYQLLYQLMFRALERQQPDQLMELAIQTNDTEHPFLHRLEAFDYSSFIKEQLSLRNQFGFPPFCKLSTIILRAVDESLLERYALPLQEYLQTYLPEEQITVIKPPVSKVEDHHIRHIIIRRPLTCSYKLERQRMHEAEQWLKESFPESKRIRIEYDIDPL